MINFCHISPTNYLKTFCQDQDVHLVLAHLIESDKEYRSFYRNVKGIKILDNSAFEMYKQNKPMFSSDKLIALGKVIDANYIVLSDYPGENWMKTRDAAIELIPQFKAAGFKTFYVPQSQIGDLAGYIENWIWALQNDNIDLIGLSILGAPNAFGVEEDNNLQRFMSRWWILKILKSQGLLDMDSNHNHDKIHCLGMVDGPNEIELLSEFHDFIYSWDSSSAVWAGLNGVEYDGTPTGLINGKFSLEVDFKFDQKLKPNRLLAVRRNMSIIKMMCDPK